MTVLDHRGPFLSRAELAARGWSRAMVARLLDPPDSRRPNPFYRGASPMCLYRLDRVEEVEAGEEFAVRAERARRRSHTARAAADRRRQALLAEVRGLEVRVPELSQERLASAAVRHRNERESDRCYLWPDHEYAEATVGNIGAATLLRWEVNYLRHELTHYDRLLRRIVGHIGRADAERVIRAKVYRAIAASYPRLATECERQPRVRGDPGDFVKAY